MASIFVAYNVSYSDPEANGTEGKPWHLKKGLENLSPTDNELIMLAGTFTNPGYTNSGGTGSKLLFEYGTQESERITIRGEGPNTTKWRCSSTSAPALTFSQTCQFLTVKDIEFDGVNGTHNDANGIKVFTQQGNDLNNIIFDHITIYNTASNGLQFLQWCNSVTVKNSIFYNCGRVNTTANLIYGAGFDNTYQDNVGYFTQAWIDAQASAGYSHARGCFRLYTNGASIGVAGPGGGPAAVESHDNLIERCEGRGARFNFLISGNDVVMKNNLSLNPIEIHYLYTAQSGGTNDGYDLWNNTGYSTSGTGVTGIEVILNGETAGDLDGFDLCNNGIYGPATAQTLSGVTTIRNTTNLTTDPTFNDTSPADLDRGNGGNFGIASAGNWDKTGTDLADPEGVVVDFNSLSRPQDTTYCVGAFEVPNPPTENPVVGLSTSYSGPVGQPFSLSQVTVTDPDGDARNAYISTTGSVTLSANAGTGSATVEGGT